VCRASATLLEQGDYTMKYEHKTDKGVDSAPNGSDAQYPNTPAIMQLRDGRIISVHHWFRNEHGRVCVYFENRQSGIDARYHDDEVLVIAQDINAAAHALGVDYVAITEEVGL